MNDEELAQTIRELADEEHELERSHAGEALTGAELQRMRDIEVSLDQCWDLLRQRRARRDAGENPDDARVRAESTVESYEQ